jgi:hypothetical protein
MFIISILSTSSLGVGHERLFVRIAKEDHTLELSWATYNKALSNLKAEGLIFRGETNRWYDGPERTT